MVHGRKMNPYTCNRFGPSHEDQRSSPLRIRRQPAHGREFRVIVGADSSTGSARTHDQRRSARILPCRRRGVGAYRVGVLDRSPREPPVLQCLMSEATGLSGTHARRRAGVRCLLVYGQATPWPDPFG